jgi:chemotaxis protein MotB
MNTSKPFNRFLIGETLISAMVLTGCVSQSKYDALQAKNTDLQNQVTTQSQQISTQQADIAAKQAQLARLQGAIKYTANSDLLFKPGGWELSKGGKKIIAALAHKLAPTQERKILVSGYTDNAPIGAKLAKQGVTSNQILSEKRAENVMQFLISQGLKPELAEAKGFGEADPIASNKTAEGRKKNRRVELSLEGAGS